MDDHLDILKDIRKELQLTNELKSVWLRNNDYYSTGIMFSLFITALCIKTILSMENFQRSHIKINSSC